MKILFKSTILLATVFASLLFINCNNDDALMDEVSYLQEGKYVIKTISRAEVSQNSIVYNKVTKPENNSLSRGPVYDSNNDIYILTNNVKYIETIDGLYHSYTFPVIRENCDNVENILLSLQEDGTYKSYLVSYNFTEEQVDQVLNNLELTGDYTINKTIIELDEGLFDNQYSIQNDCDVDVSIEHVTPAGNTYVYNEGDTCYHNTPGDQCEINYVITISCETSGGSSGGNTTGGDTSNDSDPFNNTTGGGSGGQTNDPSPTDPYPDTTTPTVDFAGSLIKKLDLIGTPEADFLNMTINSTIVDQLWDYMQSDIAIDALAIEAIQDLMAGECLVALPFDMGLNQDELNDLNIFQGVVYNTTPVIQQDHNQIKQTYNQLKSTSGKQAAIDYIINTYNMNSFGVSLSTSNFSYSFNFTNGTGTECVSTHTQNTLTGDIHTTINIPNGFFSESDWGYVTRSIKHELYHVLQVNHNQTLSHDFREFHAYYKTIFDWRNLPFANASKQQNWAEKIAGQYYPNLTEQEKNDTQTKNRWTTLNKRFIIVKKNSINCND